MPPYRPNQRELVWLNLELEGRPKGIAHKGRRPFIVLSNQAYNASMHVLRTVPITGKDKNFDANILNYAVDITNDDFDGGDPLKKESLVLVDRICAINCLETDLEVPYKDVAKARKEKVKEILKHMYLFLRDGRTVVES